MVASIIIFSSSPLFFYFKHIIFTETYWNISVCVAVDAHTCKKNEKKITQMKLESLNQINNTLNKGTLDKVYISHVLSFFTFRNNIISILYKNSLPLHSTISLSSVGWWCLQILFFPTSVLLWKFFTNNSTES